MVTKSSTKKSDDAAEVGASKAGVIVLGRDKFGNTKEDIRQVVLRAQAGIVDLDVGPTPVHFRRGHYLEPSIVQWAWDDLIGMAPDDVEISVTIPEDAHRIEKERMAATLDAMLYVSGGELNIWSPFGEYVTVHGWGAFEIKTDNNDDGPPRDDQVLQLHQQMMCAGLEWGLIAKFGPKQTVSLWPYKRDEDLCGIILQKVREFWWHVDNDVPFSEPVDEKPDAINLDKDEAAEELRQLIIDYNKAKAEIASWTSTKEQVQETIENIMDSRGAQYATLDGYRIEWPIRKRKAKAERFEPAKPETEYRVFSIKEAE
jgi:hypothetical protein